jgi:hypothetical protein
MKLEEKLVQLSVSNKIINWMISNETFNEAWAKCDKGDWMLFIAARASNAEENHKRIVTAACRCARMVLQYIPDNDRRPLIAVETIEKWLKDEATTFEVDLARADMYRSRGKALDAFAEGTTDDTIAEETEKRVLASCAKAAIDVAGAATTIHKISFLRWDESRPYADIVREELLIPII